MPIGRNEQTFMGLCGLVGALALSQGFFREDLTRVSRVFGSAPGSLGYYGNVVVDSAYDPFAYKALALSSVIGLAYNAFVRKDRR